ncbi:hypothetical protein DVH05_009998 [Phytophthora capsici]|nr:hypothetical protein DVH05_009998 [Phytophthora capsici]
MKWEKVPPQSAIYQPRDERTKQRNKGQTRSLDSTPSRLMMMTKYADKMDQTIAGATAGNDLVQVKQQMTMAVLQGEPVRGAEERPILKQLIVEEKDTAVQRKPEPVEVPWSRVTPVMMELTQRSNVVTPELAPRASKRAPQLVYAEEQKKNSRNWSKSSEGLPTKKMRSQEFIRTPPGEDVALIASPPGTGSLTNYSRTRSLLSEEGADTERARVVTSWSSKWNAWLVDLTADDESDCGSPKLTTNSSGETDVCARSSGLQPKEEWILEMEEKTYKRQKMEPEQQSQMDAPPPEAGTLP